MNLRCRRAHASRISSVLLYGHGRVFLKKILSFKVFPKIFSKIFSKVFLFASATLRATFLVFLLGMRTFHSLKKLLLTPLKKYLPLKKGFALKATLVKATLVLLLLGGALAAQQNLPLPFFNFDLRQAQNSSEVSLSLQILLLLSVLALVPSIFIMMTSFVRVAIILKFVQRALSLQQEPPNQVIMGLALFITFFIMAPTATIIYEQGYKPYIAQEISTQEFFGVSSNTLKAFMLKQTREKDIDLFLYLAGKPRPATPSDISIVSLIPAFLISEITVAFQIGVYLFVPFIVIDMIVASILMSMGMILIPPVMISLPFKIILFVLVDGWHLITLQTIRSFNL